MAQAAELLAERSSQADMNAAGRSFLGELTAAQKVLAAVNTELESERAARLNLAAASEVRRRRRL